MPLLPSRMRSRGASSARWPACTSIAQSFLAYQIQHAPSLPPSCCTLHSPLPASLREPSLHSFMPPSLPSPPPFLLSISALPFASILSLACKPPLSPPPACPRGSLLTPCPVPSLYARSSCSKEGAPGSAASPRASTASRATSSITVRGACRLHRLVLAPIYVCSMHTKSVVSAVSARVFRVTGHTCANVTIP